MLIQRDTQVPGLKEARAIQAEIKRLGVRDVELFYDGSIGVWAVCQVRQQNTGILTMDNLSGTKVQQMVMWYCTNNEGKFRPPNKDDVNNVVATVRRAQEVFKRGGDWLADQLDREDEQKRQKKEELHKERVKPHMKRLKRAIREELG